MSNILRFSNLTTSIIRVAMDISPPCKFLIVDEAHRARFPYEGYFFPRAGDFINIGGICLKVIGVSINTAQADRAAVHHSVEVYVEKTPSPFSEANCEVEDLVDYCERVRDRLL
jgi:uncharacterized NAD-dependent epimerase/dehydratase family protein